MMSDEEGERKQHFNFKSIVRAEKGSKKKRKRKHLDEEEEESQGVDTFKVNVKDERFKALFESHHFAPDPSAPQYRLVYCTFTTFVLLLPHTIIIAIFLLFLLHGESTDSVSLGIIYKVR